jgi:oxaloacetate decarboxylase gamma subunit
MTIIQMLGQSGILTVLGMAVVFAFLWIMIVVVNMTAKIIHAMGKDAEGEDAGNVSQGTVAAISAAVNEYQKNE